MASWFISRYSVLST